jgi:Na+-driven multidrug efflux pump
VRMALSRVSFVCGGVAAAVLALLRRHVSVLLFGSADYSAAIGWIGVGVWISVALASQGALLNGYRRVGDLARVSVFGGVVGTLLGIAAIALLRERGIVPMVLCFPAATWLAGAFYAGRIPAPSAVPTLGEQRQAAARQLRIGVAFTISGWMAQGSLLLVRAFLTRRFSIEASG